MQSLNRRWFLGSSFASIAGSLGTSRLLLADGSEAFPEANSTPDTLFLTWFRDPTTSMAVQWIAEDQDLNGLKLYAAPVGKEIWKAVSVTKKAFPLTDLYVYRAEFTGLLPGTEYRFSIGSESKMYRFRTMPKKATNEITFISGGDCGVNSHVIANNILAAKQDPWFAIIGGDLAYDNGKSASTFISWLRNYSAHMIDSQNRLIPMIVCIGNHEVNGSYNKKREDAPFYFAMFDGLFQETAYATLDFGDYLSLVLLDTGHVTKIAGEQTAWLEQQLHARIDHPHLFVVNHVPAYPSYRSPDVGKPGMIGTGEDQRKHWSPLFEKYVVDLVLEHHDHTFKRTHPLKGGLVDPLGILYLGDGSWGKLRVPKTPEQRPYLAKVSQSYHMTIHRIEGDQRFHMAMEENGKIVDVVMTTKKPKRKRI